MSPSPYIPRILDAKLRSAMGHFSAISIEGARAVGKTRTAQQITERWVEFDRAQQAEQFLAMGDRLHLIPQPLLLDEWPQVPESLDLVRRAVDRGAKPGTFVLTGSVDRPGVWIHSGRVLNLRMRPLSLMERTGVVPTVSLADLLQGDLGCAPLGSTAVAAEITGETDLGIGTYVEEIVSSGFPGARGVSGHCRQDFLRAYLEQIIQNDAPEAGLRRSRPASIQRWLRQYASQTSQTTPLARLSGPLADPNTPLSARNTLKGYHSLLRSLWIIDELPGWTPERTELKRANKAMKHHLVDPALSAMLLNASAARLLDVGEPLRHRELRTTSHPGLTLGALLESLAVQSIRTYAEAVGATVSHLRTKDGHEVDIIVEGADGRVVAFEMKSSPRTKSEDLDHLRWLHSRIGESLADAVILTTGSVAFRGRDGIARVPLVLLGP